MDGSEYRERRNAACCEQHEYPKRDEGREMTKVFRKLSQRLIGEVEKGIISVGRSLVSTHIMSFVGTMKRRMRIFRAPSRRADMIYEKLTTLLSSPRLMPLDARNVVS